MLSVSPLVFMWFTVRRQVTDADILPCFRAGVRHYRRLDRGALLVPAGMLMVGVGRLDHAELVEEFTRYLLPHRQSRLGEAAGHGDGGQAGDKFTPKGCRPDVCPI